MVTSCIPARTYFYDTSYKLILPPKVLQPSTNTPSNVLQRKRNPLPGLSNSTLATACNDVYMTPKCLRTLYGMDNYQIQSADRNSAAFNSFLSERANRSDAEIFLSKYWPAAVPGASKFTQLSVNGGVITQAPDNATELAAGIGQEGSIDVQVMLSLSYPTPLTVYETGGEDPHIPDPYSTFFGVDSANPNIPWLQYVLDQSDIPHTISVSWGDSEDTIPYETAVRICQLIAQLGVRGTSVFFASGDLGVGPDGGCTNGDGMTKFIRAFPASCPYVTAVGSTMGLNPEGNVTQI
jgi:tripeptidyl-peptidase-1